MNKLIASLAMVAVMMAATTTASAAPKGSNDDEGSKSEKSGIFSGLSGGVIAHAGYGFASNPEDLFRNGSLAAENLKDIGNLPKDGAFFGIGGELRIHLINHIHLGAEGNVSLMPLKQSGQVKTAWGGALIDFYGKWGRVKPFIGGSIGGGQMNRTYVKSVTEESDYVTDNSNVMYNASVTKTPFFYLDPQIGMDITILSGLGLQVKMDWMLPFNSKSEGIASGGTALENMKNWKGFMTPSGPRLYVGIMIGK